MDLSQYSFSQLYLIILSFYGAGSLVLMYFGLALAALRTKQMRSLMKLLCLVPVLQLWVWSYFLNGDICRQFWKLEFWNVFTLVLFCFCLYNPAPWVTRDITLMYGRRPIAATLSRLFPWTVLFTVIFHWRHGGDCNLIPRVAYDEEHDYYLKAKKIYDEYIADDDEEPFFF